MEWEIRWKCNKCDKISQNTQRVLRFFKRINENYTMRDMIEKNSQFTFLTYYLFYHDMF